MKDWINKIVVRIGIDKVAHFFGSAFLVLALGKFVHWAIAAGIVLILGIIKELIDIQIDKKDLLADFLGIVIGSILLLL